jgi:hypothetical protein
VQLLWERTDTELKLIARSPRPISKVIDAEPPLYVDDLGQIGELTGVTAPVGLGNEGSGDPDGDR